MRATHLLKYLRLNKGRWRFLWLISALLWLTGCATVEKPTQPVSAEFYTLMNQTSESEPLDERIAKLSGVLLGIPYQANGLGEGASGEFDQDPLVRFDVFDCTTFVETVLAGAFSHSNDAFLHHLNHLRYQNGQVSFVTRNHFPSADWIPNNQAYLSDITDQVAQDSLAYAHTVIDKKAWYQHIDEKSLNCELLDEAQCQALIQKLRQLGQDIPPQPVVTPYVPISALYLGLTIEHEAQWTGLNEALLARIPSGSVISVVRPDWALKKWIGTNMNVSHQGLAIRKNGRLFLRHASQETGRVVDVDFTEYFSAYLAWSSIKGFNVLQANLTPSHQ